MLTQKNYENEIFYFQISTCDTLLEINPQKSIHFWATEEKYSGSIFFEDDGGN